MDAIGLAPVQITIVGGGFSGASAAIQLVRASPSPLFITIVEERESVGGGLAHSAEDPDHRLNAPAFVHYIDPRDPEEFQRWYLEGNLAEKDPGARLADGSLYVRRKDFGAFVSQSVKLHANAATGSRIRHVRDVAEGLTPDKNLLTVKTKTGLEIPSHMVIVATGNAPPRLPAEFRSVVQSPAVIASPTDLHRIRAIAKSAHVLVLGSGLTALDVLSTLVRSGHQGRITALSRRGLRPATQRPSSGPQQIFHLSDKIAGPVAPFILEAGNPPTMRSLVRALRSRIREVEAAGDLWYTPYDQVRDTFWKVWPTVPLNERKRFFKRLRPYFDTFRFRSPPQNEALVGQAEKSGQIHFCAARVVFVENLPNGSIGVVMRDKHSQAQRPLKVDAIINCTGLDSAAGVQGNLFLASLLEQGLISGDATGVGLAADADCRAVDRNGNANEALRIVGPPINGQYPDQVGAPFIASHIHRALPSFLHALEGMRANEQRSEPGDR